MLETITDLLDYVEKNSSSFLSDNLEKQFGKTTLRVMLINIFSWLKRNKKFNNRKPLNLTMRCKWHKKVIKLINNNKEMQDIFEIENNLLRLNEELSSDMKEQIIEYVFDSYSPQLRSIKK